MQSVFFILRNISKLAYISLLACSQVAAHTNIDTRTNNSANSNNSSSTPTQTSEGKTKYRIGISYVNGYPFFSLSDIQDKGMGWAILEHFAASKNIEFEYALMPITRLQPAMDIGAIDFIFPDNPLWSSYRSNRLPNIFSGPILRATSTTFVRKENKHITIDQINKVAIPFGYTAFTWFGPIKQYNIQSIPVRDLYTALHTVVQGTTQAADVEYNIGSRLIADNPNLRGLSIASNLPSINVDYHLSTIKHITLLEDLTAFVAQEKTLIEQLKTHYDVKYYDEVYSDTKH